MYACLLLHTSVDYSSRVRLYNHLQIKKNAFFHNYFWSGILVNTYTFVCTCVCMYMC